VALDKPHSKFPHVYAVVRTDIPFDEHNPGNSISVVKVDRSREAAEAEVSRLNGINADKNCTYVCCISRLID
jgi:hypothetical protein